MDHIEYDFMEGMSEEQIDGWLADHDVGVLSLARDGAAYAVPVNYAYLDGSLFVRLAREADSKKFDYVAATEEACLVVYGDSDGATWSVIATGPIEDVTDERAATFDDAGINETFGPLHVFDQPIEELDVLVYELNVQVLTGRKTES